MEQFIKQIEYVCGVDELTAHVLGYGVVSFLYVDPFLFGAFWANDLMGGNLYDTLMSITIYYNCSWVFILGMVIYFKENNFPTP